MSTQNEDTIIQNTVVALIEILARNSPLRSKAAKSTFNVSPEKHRILEIICRITNMTKQDFFDLALEKMLTDKDYVKKIPIEDLKTMIEE